MDPNNEYFKAAITNGLAISEARGRASSLLTDDQRSEVAWLAMSIFEADPSVGIARADSIAEALVRAGWSQSKDIQKEPSHG